MTISPTEARLAAPAGSRRARYLQDGVVLVPGLLPADEIAQIRDVFTSTVESDNKYSILDTLPKNDILTRYPRFVHPHRHTDREAGQIARRLMNDERITNVLEELIGPAYGAQSMFYFKPPTARGQAFHQDNFFLRTEPETCIATWIAVDDADENNGALIVLPGTHKNEVMCHGDADLSTSFSANTVLGLPSSCEKFQSELHAGDALFFHGSLVHGSKPNSSTDRFRRCLIFHHCPRESTMIAKFYQPLVGPDGEDLYTGVSDQGGPCGEAWREES